jgi:hypothetical protein
VTVRALFNTKAQRDEVIERYGADEPTAEAPASRSEPPTGPAEPTAVASPPAPAEPTAVVPPPTPAQPSTPRPVSAPAAAEVSIIDVTNTGRQFLYWARRRCTHRAEAFDRTSTVAIVRLNYDVNVSGRSGEGGGPADDDPTAVRLTLDWPGSASERTVAGATATARIGDVVVHWISL